MEFQQLALQIAQEEGFLLAGFTMPQPRTEWIRRYKERRLHKGLTLFEPENLLDRFDIRRHWPFCKSVLAVALSYYGDGPENIQPGEGVLSRIAWGRDYHLVLEEKMQRVVQRLFKVDPTLEYAIQVDTGSLSDRAAAWEGGLGFMGKNGFLIHPQAGSFLALGQIAFNREVSDPAQVLESRCGTCRKCMDACPTGAILEDGVVLANRCISYLTQKRGVLDRWERSTVKDHIYGCDLCQNACPFNKTPWTSEAKELRWDGNREIFSLKTLLNMDAKEFHHAFSSRAAGWRGKNLLQRNALIACGHNKTEENFLLIQSKIASKSPILRLHAYYALEAYGREEAAYIRRKLEDETLDFRTSYQKYH